MKKKAQPVSTKKDNVTWCHPSAGYPEEIDIEWEFDDYTKIATVDGILPPSDETWPKGAPVVGVFKVGNEICQRKIVS